MIKQIPIIRCFYRIIGIVLNYRRKNSLFVMKQFTFIGIFILLLFSVISCKKKASGDKWDDTISTGIIKIASDEDFKALIDAEIDVFEARNNYQAVIEPIYTSEAEAIRLLIDDTVRLAVVTRDLNTKERREIESKNMNARKHLIAFDGIALITNPQNPDSILGIPTLKKILTGEITEWSQINPDTPFGTIRVLFDNQESGVLRYLIDSVLHTASLSPNIYALQNNLEVMEKVVEMPNTIGLIGVNVLSDEASPEHLNLRKQIRLMRVGKEENANLQNSFLPYAGDILQENYPLWRPVYVLVSDPKTGLSSGFSVFLSNEIGQRIILKSGLLPITDPHVRPVRIVN